MQTEAGKNAASLTSSPTHSDTALPAVAPRRVIAALESMLLIRAFEERSAALQLAGKSPHRCSSAGQEAAAVGVVHSLRCDDQILTNRRNAGHILARGADPGRLLAEMHGKATGYCKGKSGSPHVAVKELGVLLTSTIVGGELSLVTGVGLSRSMSQSDAIVVCFFGDGAACQGVFHESLNLACIWSLPILYVCENNQLQAFVHRDETMLTEHIAAWARPYGMQAYTADGNDLEAVLDAATDAVNYVRRERKPYFLETYTYRLHGHMASDNLGYVGEARPATWLQKDPIDRLAARLLARGVIATADFEAMRTRANERVEAAVQFSFDSPYPDSAELGLDVYV